MYRFLQKHGKKIMAIFGAFLMISFTLPAAYQYGQGGRDPIIGRIEGEKLRASELFESRRSWEIVNSLAGGRGGNAAEALLGPTAVAQINQQPVLFLLLQKEAQKMGATVSNDVVESAVRNAPGLLSGNDDRDALTRRAIADLLLVRQGLNLATSAIKVTEPMIRHELAELQQSITLGAVEFNLAQYIDKVPAPTAEQLRTQFEKYADVIKGQAGEGNPFGFGYRYPDRVKLQYIVVPRADVRKVVEAEKNKDPYAFTVEAQRYYIQNQNLYAASQPATTAPAADDFSLGSGGVKKPTTTTAPTTRPFADVEKDIKNRIIERETAARQQAILNRINQQLASDWAAYSAAVGKNPAPATQASTQASATQPAIAAPPTSLGAPYYSFDYLKNLAGVIQKSFGVLPTVVSKADNWLTHDDLQAIAGIGQATFNGVPMADYVMAFAAPFIQKSEQGDQTGMIQVLEPTRPMQDSAGSEYIARISAAEPSHKPAALTEVEAAVRADVIKQQAYELAKVDAAKLLDQARQQGLATATGGQRLVTAGPLTQRPGQVVPTLSLSGDAAARFIEGAFKLLSTPTSRPSAKPVRLVEMPQDGKVIVAELGNVDATWNERTRPMMEAEIQRMIAQQLAMQFADKWFDYDAVTSRLKFVPDEDYKDQEAPAAPSRPRPPIF